MPANIEQVIMEGLRRLPPERQKEVADFVQGLIQKNNSPKTIWEKIDERVKRVPSDVWEGIPTDGAEQHDHYLYGAPKK